MTIRTVLLLAWFTEVVGGTGLAPVAACAQVAEARTSVAETSKADRATLADAVRSYVERRELAGAVMLVADADGVAAVEAVGRADVAADRPMKTDAVFWIASQSKPITAAALMMLVDEGKVSLDDPVEKYLPEFKDQWLVAEQDAARVLLRRPARKVSVRDLLRHTSGMPFRSLLEQPTLDALRLADGVRSYAMTNLIYEPGTKYVYSNAGINTAGRIIEVVSGMPYEKFLDERLFQPLGMRDTTFRPSGEQLMRLAKSYKPNAKKDGLEETPISQLTYPLDDPRRTPMPAGGLFSTAHDVALFCRMMLRRGELDGRRYLSEAAVAEMTRRQTPESLPQAYGLGFAVGPGNFGHGGAMATNMTVDVERGLVLVWLVQHAGFPGAGAKAQGAFRDAASARFARRNDR